MVAGSNFKLHNFINNLLAIKAIRSIVKPNMSETDSHATHDEEILQEDLAQGLALPADWRGVLDLLPNTTIPVYARKSGGPYACVGEVRIPKLSSGGSVLFLGNRQITSDGCTVLLDTLREIGVLVPEGQAVNVACVDDLEDLGSVAAYGTFLRRLQIDSPGLSTGFFNG